MHIEVPKSPWLKPTVYKEPTDAEALNSKLDPEKVENRKKLEEHLNNKRDQQDSWDALEMV